MHTRTLMDMKMGETGAIGALNTGGSAGKRLLDLGFIRGAPITVALESPMGNPRAYRVAGAMIALRNRDAARIEARPLEGSERA